MDDIFTRSKMLLGESAVDKLKKASVVVFGIGGVGSFAVEALARMGIGRIDVADGDKYSLSNLNRQLYATVQTVGKYKADVAKERILIINPDCKVVSYNLFFCEETESFFDLSEYDYIIDAIDSVNDKVNLIIKAKKAGVPIISSMGAGNKTDPTKFKVADIYSTSVCPLARVMRDRLKKAGIESLKTVYSTESPVKTFENGEVGSVSFVPSVAGLIIAGEAVKDIIS